MNTAYVFAGLGIIVSVVAICKELLPMLGW
jgi:hypothetical protein